MSKYLTVDMQCNYFLITIVLVHDTADITRQSKIEIVMQHALVTNGMRSVCGGRK